MISQLYRGLSDYGLAINMISKHNLWAYVISPGLLSVLTVGLLIGGPIGGFILGGGEEAVEGFLLNLYPFEWGKAMVENIISWFPFWLLLLLILTGAMFFVGKYIILIVASPFMGALSERVEEITTGLKPPSDSNFFVDLLRSIRISVRNLIRETGLTLLFLFFHLIPVIGTIVATGLTLLVQAYFAGFGNMDYTLERKSFNVSESVAFVSKNRGSAIGNGIGFLLILAIPVIGWFLAPAYATVSATRSVLRRLEKEEKSI